jgi:hypothetical protein
LPKEKEQTTQWPKEEEQTTQWPNIVLSVLVLLVIVSFVPVRFTASDYPFDIFKLFLAITSVHWFGIYIPILF